jgi:exonuclease SbcC
MPIVPEKLEVQGFFAFRQKQTIDFQPLWKTGGLWGILGQNGAGKSSILEAMLLALYGRSPRSESQGRTDPIRTKGFKGEPQALLWFSHKGQRYVFGFPAKAVREAAKKAPSIQVLAGSKEVKSLLGLDYEDFVLSVILPQGRFADLLKATATKQVEMLADLLPHRPWEEIEKAVSDVLKVLNDHTNSLEGKINSINEQLSALSRHSQSELEELEKQKTSWSEKIKQLDNFLSDLKVQLSKAEQRDKIKSLVQNLEKQIQAHSLNQQAVEKLTSDIINRLNEFINSQKRLSEVKEKLKAANSKREDLEKQKAKLNEQLQEKQEAFEPLCVYYERWTEFSNLLTLKAAYDKTLAQVRGELKKINEDIQALGLIISPLGERASKEVREQFWTFLRQAKQEAEKAQEAFLHQIQELMKSQALADFVRALKSGEPCPVCGSSHHPNPRSIPDDIDAEIQEAQQKLKEQQKKAQEIATILGSQSSIETLMHNYERDRAELIQSYRHLCTSVSKEKVDELLKNPKADKVYEEALKLQKQCADLQNRLSTLEGQLKAKESDIANLTEEIAKMQSAYNSEKNYLEAFLPPSHPFFQEIWKQVAGAHIGQLTQWIENCKNILREYEENHQKLNSEEYALLHPTEELRKDKGEQEALLQKHKQALSKVEQEIGRVQAGLEQKKKLETALNALEAQKEKLTQHQKLVEKVKEATGKGALKQFIVREILMKGLIGRVNAYLRQWLGEGSLQLRLPPEEGQPLVVEDLSYGVGEMRPTGTLSGGEQFLVSLAMALTLSETLSQIAYGKTHGGQESFFLIDEGFDTLSRENFAMVMRTLQELAAQGRRIGLISHKIEARDYLSAYILVEKKEGATQVEVWPSYDGEKTASGSKARTFV